MRGFKNGANDFDSRIRCGDTMLKLGNAGGAIDQWQRAKACWPSCTEQETSPELRLARLYRDQGERTQAQMEMKSYCRRTARAFTPRYTLAEFEKEAGNPNIERLRIIQLLEADFNLYLKLKIGRDFMLLAEAHNLLDAGMFGGRRRLSAHDASIFQRLKDFPYA